MFEHMSHQHHKEKFIGMVSIKKSNSQWITRVARESELKPVLVMTQVEVVHDKEVPR